MTSRAAGFIPPVLIFTALVLQNAAGGFPALGVLFHPLALSGAVVVVLVAIPGRMERDALRETASSLALWTGWAFFAALGWSAAESAGFVGNDWMLPAFLGLDAPFSAAWFRALAAGAIAFSAACALRSRGRVLRAGVALLLTGFFLLAFDSASSSRAPVEVVPSRTVDHFFRPDTGELERMPYSVQVLGFERDVPRPPWILKVSDRRKRRRLFRAVVGPAVFSLPGTQTKLEVLADPVNAVLHRSLKPKSRDFLSPAIALREKKDGKTLWEGILYGTQLGANSLFLPHCRLPVHYRHYDEKADCELLAETDLPWLPLVVVGLSEPAGRYVLRAVRGTKLAVPKSHYALRVEEALPGDLASGEKGRATVVLQGPLGEEKYLLGEDTLSLRGKKYPNCTMLYLHPRTEGESFSFVRLFSAPDGKLSREVFIDGVRRRESGGETLAFGDVRLEVSEPVPEATLAEVLTRDENGVACPAVRLLREGGERKELVLSPEAAIPTELPREELFLSAGPAVGGGVSSVKIRVRRPGYAAADVTIRPGEPFSADGCTVAVLDYDRLLGSRVVLAITKSSVGPLPLWFLLGGFLFLAWTLTVRYYDVLEFRSGADAGKGEDR